MEHASRLDKAIREAVIAQKQGTMLETVNCFDTLRRKRKGLSVFLEGSTKSVEDGRRGYEYGKGLRADDVDWETAFIGATSTRKARLQYTY